MFCFQCEQTYKGHGCTQVGVCGKTPAVAGLQDVLNKLNKEIAQYLHLACAAGAKRNTAAERWLNQSMFATLTNVNFDDERFLVMIKEGQKLRTDAKQLYKAACRGRGQTAQAVDELALPSTLSKDALVALVPLCGVEAQIAKKGADLAGVTEMAFYGLKGAIAYWEHACRLGAVDDDINAEFLRLMGMLNSNISLDEALGAALAVGALNLKVTECLERFHCQKLGIPAPNSVSTTPLEGKCILVSGHDLDDLEHLLKQTVGKGINVYTHGEMLPAHGYPKLREHKHLAGHFGGPWNLQKIEFADFPGPILMTSNCLVEPRPSYKDRVYTAGVVGFPGVKHIPEGSHDFSKVIAQALKEPGFTKDDIPDKPNQPLLTGFGKDAILGIADVVISAVEQKAISRFFVIGGCDGAEPERNYYTKLAQALPKDAVVLTMGCGKFRVNRLPMGDIGGIPRVLDMGQCNDSFGAVQVALALASHFKCGVNDLPLSFAISWFEQKAVAVLLTLLHLNVQNIRLGPALPGFATPAVLNVLVDKFKIHPIGDHEVDLKNMMNGQ
eukprot:gb/GEZN01002936.1/.p1 GENE.gb/GEZN01002936.1/~~gb/GEZN01002936.1/.p1  ORF type:complete len:623 (+),score=109.80 gb/GEZN01002936.1/:207-1871(+)